MTIRKTIARANGNGCVFASVRRYRGWRVTEVLHTHTGDIYPVVVAYTATNDRTGRKMTSYTMPEMRAKINKQVNGR